MGASQVALPDGFVLDSPSGLPPGFTLDKPHDKSWMDTYKSDPIAEVESLVNGAAQGVAGIGQVAAKALPSSMAAPVEGWLAKSVKGGNMRQAELNDRSSVAPALSEIGKASPYIAATVASPATALGRIALGATANTAMGVAKPVAEGERYDRGNLARIAKDAAVGGTLGAVPEIASSAAKAVKATSDAAGDALRWVKGEAPSNVSTAAATAVDASKSARKVVEVLRDQHADLSKAEDSAWQKVRDEAAGKTVPYKQIPKIQSVLMDAQASSGHNILSSQLANLNRFVDAGLDVPAENVIRMRQALSKASSQDAGLRDAVSGIDGIIGDSLKVKSLPQARAKSRERFGKFVDQAAVAKAIAEDTTPETAGHVLLQDKSQAGDVFDQVIHAAGSKAPEARAAMQQGVIHNVISSAIKSYKNDGTPVVAASSLADGIFNLSAKNKSLWNRLEPSQRTGLLSLASSLKSQQGGPVNIGKNIVGSLLGIKTRVVLNATGANEFLKPGETMTLPEVLKLLNRRK